MAFRTPPVLLQLSTVAFPEHKRLRDAFREREAPASVAGCTSLAACVRVDWVVETRGAGGGGARFDSKLLPWGVGAGSGALGSKGSSGTSLAYSKTIGKIQPKQTQSAKREDSLFSQKCPRRRLQAGGVLRRLYPSQWASTEIC